MELHAFFTKANKDNPELVKEVKKLIAQGDSKAVWAVIQDYLNVKLVGK